MNKACCCHDQSGRCGGIPIGGAIVTGVAVVTAMFTIFPNILSRVGLKIVGAAAALSSVIYFSKDMLERWNGNNEYSLTELKEDNSLIKIPSHSTMHDMPGNALFVASPEGSHIHICSGAGLKYIIASPGSDVISFLNGSGGVYGGKISVISGYDEVNDILNLEYTQDQCLVSYNKQKDYTLVRCEEDFAIALLGNHLQIDIDYISA